MLLLKKFLPHIGVGLSVVILLFVVYSVGSNHGKAKVQNQWDQAVLARAAEIDKLKGQFAEQEKNNRAEVNALSNKLTKAETEHAQELISVRSNLLSRLQQSELRGQVYQRQANSGPTDSASLASHAAQLDRSLEQGRGLVKELTATIRLRDDQLRLLGQQIISDRKLLGETENGNTNSY